MPRTDKKIIVASIKGGVPNHSYRTAPSDEVARLRAAIVKLTHRSVISTDPVYLRRRLADLETRKAGGEDVRPHRERRPQTPPMSISMPSEDVRRAFDQLVERERAANSSALIRKAVAELAQRRGHADLARRIMEED